MLRVMAAVLSWCTAIGAASVASTNYWAPLLISLVSVALYAATVLPYWRVGGQRRVLLFAASLPLAFVTAHTLFRLSTLALALR